MLVYNSHPSHFTVPYFSIVTYKFRKKLPTNKEVKRNCQLHSNCLFVLAYLINIVKSDIFHSIERRIVNQRYESR
jgi:formyltetrahydrofolate hydrolase